MLRTITLCLLICCLTGCGYTIRVVDTQGKPIHNAKVTYQRFSMLFKEEAGTTNKHGIIKLWTTIPAVECAWAEYGGVTSDNFYVGKHNKINIILPDKNTATTPLSNQTALSP